MLPEHLQTKRVIPDGLEPSLSWLSPRRLYLWTTGSQSDRGRSRTCKHEALDLAALPICVPGRKWRVRGLHPTVGAYEAPLSTGPPARQLQAPVSNRAADLMRVNWAPAASAVQSDQGEIRTPKPCGRRSERRASTGCATWSCSSSGPCGSRTLPFQLEGLASCADRRTGHASQCVGQELNLHSRGGGFTVRWAHRCPADAYFPSGTGGSRTRNHQGLGLAALPICVPCHAYFSAPPDGPLSAQAVLPGVSPSAPDGI